MSASGLTDRIKNWVLILGALGGMGAGLYAAIAKPIQDENRVKLLETQMNEIKPSIREHETNIAVLKSQLVSIKEDQGKILDVVLDIKKRL